MKPLDTLAAISATVVWGLTFVAIKYGVEEAPPFLLTAMRFAFAAIPFVFFVRPPAAPWRIVAIYGVLIGVCQFGLLFLGVRLGMPVGLASLVVQSQVYFTVLFAALIFRERPTPAQFVGGLVSLAGMVLIGWARWANAAFAPFALTVGAGFCWAAGNTLGKRLGHVDPLAFIAWSSLVAPAPMFALSAVLEPAPTFAAALHPSWRLLASVAFLAWGGTLYAYGVWAKLLAKYTAGAVSPFALLVPVVGMGAAAVLFNERPSALEGLGALGVLVGLAINVAGARVRGVLRRRIA